MPTITSIKRQKNHRRRFSVFVDGDFRFGCSSAQLAGFDLHEDDRLTEGRLEEIVRALEESSIRNLALLHLSRRDRSRYEMESYLKRKGFESGLIEQTLQWLFESNYLDDDKFTRYWVEMRLRTAPRGRRRLLAELRQKGIESKLAATVIDENLPAEKEREVAYRLLRGCGGRWLGQERLEMRRRVFNFLRYRGFSGTAAVTAGSQFLEEMFESSRD